MYYVYYVGVIRTLIGKYQKFMTCRLVYNIFFFFLIIFIIYLLLNMQFNSKYSLIAKRKNVTHYFSLIILIKEVPGLLPALSELQTTESR